ncbi:hypothetical protein GPLA_3895 [Paraglaciecola polaris LMG 21857]|uniref:Uncharacterized protein n=1 Tax=Paraglaciecola polaris LMG 21857 TaxID=1129793 RepID=K7AHR4_9ALTE|nr:hypothetical protein GPLA_3895 [Paraglaciecola polaris LMG 21857]
MIFTFNNSVSSNMRLKEISKPPLICSHYLPQGFLTLGTRD